MKLTYDPEANAAYLRFKEERVDVETHQVSDSVWIDIAPDGTIVGIELLNANAQLKAGHAATPCSPTLSAGARRC